MSIKEVLTENLNVFYRVILEIISFLGASKWHGIKYPVAQTNPVCPIPASGTCNPYGGYPPAGLRVPRLLY